jgi:hypothetical protein
VETQKAASQRVLRPGELLLALSGKHPIPGYGVDVVAIAASNAVNPDLSPETRAIGFANSLGFLGKTADETLAYLHSEGAGPEADVAAAFDGHFDIAVASTVRVIE